MNAHAPIEAGPAHAEIVAALHAATIADTPEGAGAWDTAWIARILALPGAVAALVLAPEPAGFALCLPAGAAFDLLAIGVLPGRRRAGIGRALLAHCAARARAAGAERLVLEVAEDNETARAFYRGAGFAQLGRRKGYYRSQAGAAPRDALVLSKAL